MGQNRQDLGSGTKGKGESEGVEVWRLSPWENEAVIKREEGADLFLIRVRLSLQCLCILVEMSCRQSTRGSWYP